MTPKQDLVSIEDITIDVQSGFASGERATDGVVQLRMNNVTTDGNLDWSSYLRVPTSPKQVEKYKLRPGDILFNNTNSPELVGKTTIFNGFNEPVVFSNHFVRLRVDETWVYPQYLARWFTMQWQQRVFERLSTQWVNQAAVRKEDLLALKIPLPPLAEQQRIASLLTRADRLRRLRRHARELSGSLLQSVFLEMFGDPKTNPKGWKVEKIGKHIKNIRYGTGSPPDYQEKGIPFIRATNVKQGTIKLNGLVYISEEDAKKISKCRINAGDLIVVRSGVNSGDCALIPPEYDGAYAAYDLIVEVPYPTNYFLNIAINSLFGKIIIETLSRRAGQPHVNAEQIESMEFPFPPLPLQEQFAGVVARHESLRRRQAESARQAEGLFQSMLNEAFRG